MKSKRLNIGCGKNARKDCINLDTVKLPGVEVVHNLDKYPWPFKDNTFEEVYCFSVLEHLNDIIKPLEEIHRISKNKAKIIISVPIASGVGAFADPTHKVFYEYTSFDYFKPDNYLNYYSKARFNIIKRKLVFYRWLGLFTWFFNLSGFLQRVHTIFIAPILPAYSLEVELENVKEILKNK